MKVLHLISSSGFFGAENVLIELSKELRDTSFSPFIGVLKNLHNPHLEAAEEAKKYNLPIKIFPCKGKLDLKTIVSIRKFLGQQKIDIIHTHGYKSNLYALASSLGMKVYRVTTCHNWLGESQKMKFYARLDKIFLNRSNKIVAVSDSVIQEILKHNISPKKVKIIYYGINLERFTNTTNRHKIKIKSEFGIEEGSRVIGTVGRLTKEKGHVYLLQAARKILQKYPETVFLIIGDGPLRQN